MDRIQQESINRSREYLYRKRSKKLKKFEFMQGITFIGLGLYLMGVFIFA